MDVNVVSKKDNPLLKRMEAECIVNFEQGTPKKEEMKQEIAKALAANPELVYIYKFIVRAGAKQGKAEVYVFETKEQVEKMNKKKEKKEKK